MSLLWHILHISSEHHLKLKENSISRIWKEYTTWDYPISSFVHILSLKWARCTFYSTYTSKFVGNKVVVQKWKELHVCNNSQYSNSLNLQTLHLTTLYYTLTWTVTKGLGPSPISSITNPLIMNKCMRGIFAHLHFPDHHLKAFSLLDKRRTRVGEC